jgi:HEAT repeat protein
MLVRVGRTRRSTGRFTPRTPLNDVNFITDVAKAMREGTPGEKLEALETLARRIDEGTAPMRGSALLLGETLGDADARVRRTALLTLARHGSALLEGLRGGLSNANPDVRRTSAEMIRRIVSRHRNVCMGTATGQSPGKDRDMVRSLFEALSDGEAGVRRDAFMSLSQIARRNPMLVLDERRRAAGGDAGASSGAGTIETIALEEISEQARANPC